LSAAIDAALGAALLVSCASGTLKDCVYMGFSSLLKRVGSEVYQLTDRSVG
jgi:hypothetical protein